MERGTVLAVDDVSFDLGPGEFIGVVGESGCGKSTLLFAIAQLLVQPAEITGGSVIFQGRSMVGLTDSQLAAVRWKDLSVVMQSAMNALNPVKSIGAQFKDAMRAHGTKSPTGRPRCSRWSASTPPTSRAIRTSCRAACGSAR